MENVNPGGSLGDFLTPQFKDIRGLMEFLMEHAGDLYTSNFAFLDGIRGKEVADLGSGYGYFTTALSNYTKRMDGFDVDKRAVGFATEQMLPLSNGNAHFYLFDGLNTGMQAETYDAVLSFEVLEHVPSPGKYLEEAYRIIKKGGHLFLSTPNGLIANKNDCIIKYHAREHLTEFFPSELKELLERAGFRIDRWYRKINVINDEKRNPNKHFLRRLKIRIICKLKTNDFTYTTLKAIMKLVAGQRYTYDNFKDYEIVETEYKEINPANCDVILIDACKP